MLALLLVESLVLRISFWKLTWTIDGIIGTCISFITVTFKAAAFRYARSIFVAFYFRTGINGFKILRTRDVELETSSDIEKNRDWHIGTSRQTLFPCSFSLVILQSPKETDFFGTGFFIRTKSGWSEHISSTRVPIWRNIKSIAVRIYPRCQIIRWVTFADVSFVSMMIMRIRTDEIMIRAILTWTVDKNSFTAWWWYFTCSAITKVTVLANTFISLSGINSYLHILIVIS